ncbi:hypothetical protein PPSIR1_07273 [Plesiocystis pacifica SIR-1]|uniref:Uncharacterized protein n=1 Tax=Plesiocystis pacifica SIR-1 TaxID=391625 RepID=A6G5B3_9BACT|nr:hypothetical protein PPSIR1_07273 [Plesiocystis pacifica SIR-1]
MENTQIKLCGQACADFGEVLTADVDFYCNPN